MFSSFRFLVVCGLWVALRQVSVRSRRDWHHFLLFSIEVRSCVAKVLREMFVLNNQGWGTLHKFRGARFNSQPQFIKGPPVDWSSKASGSNCTGSSSEYFSRKSCTSSIFYPYITDMWFVHGVTSQLLNVKNAPSVSVKLCVLEIVANCLCWLKAPCRLRRALRDYQLKALWPKEMFIHTKMIH